MRQPRNIKAQLQFGIRLQSASEPERRHLAVAPALDSPPSATDNTEEMHSTIREVGMEIRAMVGHQVMGV